MKWIWFSMPSAATCAIVPPRSSAPGGTLVTIASPPSLQPENGRALFFIVEADRNRLTDLAQRLRDGRLRTILGAVRPLAAPFAFNSPRRTKGKTIIQVAEGN